jgi:hypothetical protein
MAANRSRLFHLNRYQLRVLLLVLAPPVVIVSTFALLSNLFFDQLLAAVQSGSEATLVDFLSDWRFYFFFLLWGMLALIVLVTYVVSKNLLGAFTRLFREMDEMLAGERAVGPLVARKHDDLANELLDRMNRLHGKTGAAADG